MELFMERFSEEMIGLLNIIGLYSIMWTYFCRMLVVTMYDDSHGAMSAVDRCHR